MGPQLRAIKLFLDLGLFRCSSSQYKSGDKAVKRQKSTHAHAHLHGLAKARRKHSFSNSYMRQEKLETNWQLVSSCLLSPCCVCNPIAIATVGATPSKRCARLPSLSAGLGGESPAPEDPPALALAHREQAIFISNSKR